MSRHLAEVFADACDERLTAAETFRWPSRKYEHDIAAFAWLIFGIRLHPKQVAIAEAIFDSELQRTAVVACHKSGKTLLAAILALWWFCMPEGRVVLFAPRMETIEQGLYFAIRGLLRRSGVCGDCREARPGLQPSDYANGRCPHSCPITEMPHANAVDGLCSDDLREIRGYAANNPVSLQGVSGRVLILADEASGIDDDAMEAVDTSLASINARLLLTGNANRSFGVFYDAFHRDKALYNTFTIDAFEIVGYIEAGILPANDNLCSAQFIADELAKAKGDKNNSAYRRKILGLFPIDSDETLIPREWVLASAERWIATRGLFIASGEDEALFGRALGPLLIGVDPAHMGMDLTAICVVRGLLVLEIWVGAKMEPDEVARQIQLLADKYRDLPRREVASIKIDALGPGENVIRDLRDLQRRELNGIRDRIEEVRSNQPPPRRENEYLHIRDELRFVVKDWIKAGGQVPDDTLLHEELFTVTYSSARSHTQAGKLVVEDKDKVTRKRLKRSPDRADSLALALFDPHGRHEESWGAIKAEKPAAPFLPPRMPPRNPYGGSMGRPSPRSAIQGMSARLRGR